MLTTAELKYLMDEVDRRVHSALEQLKHELIQELEKSKPRAKENVKKTT